MNKKAVLRCRLILCLFAILSWIGTARADFQGNLTITPSKGAVKTGKVTGKDHSLRLDLVEGGHDFSTIINLQTRQTIVLMNQQKIAMTTHGVDPTKTPGVSCAGADADGCLGKLGYKETGKETVDGHPCRILEADVRPERGDTYHNKIWRPTDLAKEVAFVKTVSRFKSGNTVMVTVTGIKVGAQNAGLFEVPPGFRTMQQPDIAGGAMPKMPGMPNLQGLAMPKLPGK